MTDTVTGTLAAPVLIGPADDANGLDFTSIEFPWQAVAGADGEDINYSPLVCENEDFTGCGNPIVVAGITPLSIAAGLGSSGILVLGLFGMNANRRRETLALLAVFLLLSSVTACGKNGGNNPTPGENIVSYTVTDLAPGTQYFWKAIASGTTSGSAESVVRSFTSK